MMRHTAHWLALAVLVSCGGAPALGADLEAGLASVAITPREPIWMSGYASRTHASEGTYQDLWAKALALRDPGGRRVVIVTTDLIGLPRAISEAVAARVGERFGIERSALVLSASHTHTGPALDANLVVMAPPTGEEREKVEAYSAWLVERLVEVTGAALADLEPARLSAGRGRVGFAANRREPTPEGVRLGVDPRGPVDHGVPVVKVSAPDGTLRAVLFGYACHNTTLGGDLYEIGGDYAGFAQAALEDAHPGAVALFVMLCGGDQNPEPRGTLEQAREHGRALAAEVGRVLDETLQPVRPPIRTALEVVDLPYAPHTRETFEAESASEDEFRRRRARLMLAAYDAGEPVRETPLPVQAVRLGEDLTLLALGGEAVVDYALRARLELAGENLIVAAYCNDVPGYLPSRRVLREGGYEPEGSTVYYGQPGPFAESVEETVFAAVRRVARRVGATASPAPPVADERIPELDRRAVLVRDLDTPTTFTPFSDADAWRKRARFLRERILVSAGLWPMPEKSPLSPHVFGRIERDGYSVEKVFFESHPGFYVTGNLYRPLGRDGPFPGVLAPHGHWAYGRLENAALGSVPARCIALARQGYVVFSYDMVGYNDSRQVDHRLLDPVLAQWGVGSLGLHLWNSIRSLDFLESSPDVDPGRLACTGASGGGTQTFLLTAVDERVSVSAPVNMISHYMQGGDVCENAPNLRLDTSNVEIGALAAPRPLLMVSAAGDWTRDTPRIEFPAVRSVYALLGQRERVATFQLTADHNYNRESREAVYGWFARWLLGRGDGSPVPEAGYTAEQPADLLVFHGRALPSGAPTQDEITAALVEARRARLAALRPADAAGLARFREVLGPGLRHVLAAAPPAPGAVLEEAEGDEPPRGTWRGVIGRRGRGDRVPVESWAPAVEASGRAVLVVHPDGIPGVAARAASLVEPLRRLGWRVASLDAFGTGRAVAARDTSDRFFTTYNRTDDALRVQDLLTALAWLRSRDDVDSVSLVGLEAAGLWCLLAQALDPDLEAVVADAGGFPTDDDAAYLDRIFVPLLRSVGGFETALTLGLGRPLHVHGTRDAFDTAAVEAAARATGAGGLEVRRERLDDAGLVAWLTRPPS